MKRKSGVRLWALALTVLLLELLVFQGNPASAQSWIQLSPTGGPPAARVTHSTVYDKANNRMILFGGGSTFNDVWILSNADGTEATAPTWTQLSPIGTPPAPRLGHTAVYNSTTNTMTIFAGNPAPGFCTSGLNDVWVLSNANGLGGTPTWTQLSPTGGPPSVRMQPTGAYDEVNNRMIVFGGLTAACTTNHLNDVWVLTNANGQGGTPTWIQLAPTGTLPNPRFVHNAVYDSATNRMTIFGGQTSTAAHVNDTWVLSEANGLGGIPAWMQLTPTGAIPDARLAQSAVHDSFTNRMTIFGGCCGPGGLFGDVWVLSSASGLGPTPAWTQLNPTGGFPGARDSHTAVYNEDTNRMIVFGGRFTSLVGEIRLNDVWVLTDANGNVLFAAFDPKVQITLGLADNDDEFNIKANLTLGSSSDGIAPLTEAVTIRVGSFSVTIPASSFQFKPATRKKPAEFTFAGIINGVTLTAKIIPLVANSFEFKAAGFGVNLTGTVNPVPVGLILGNDQKSAKVTAVIQ